MLKRTFLSYVLVELAVVVALTLTIGLGWTLLVLLATSVLGVALSGSQARRQLLRLQEVQANPQGAMADGLLVALGTILVFVPGLATSLLGTLMLLPPTRRAVRPLAGALLARGLIGRVGAVSFAGVGDGFPADSRGRGDYIDGEVIGEQVGPQVYAPVHDAVIVRRYEAI